MRNGSSRRKETRARNESRYTTDLVPNLRARRNLQRNPERAAGKGAGKREVEETGRVTDHVTDHVIRGADQGRGGVGLEIEYRGSGIGGIAQGTGIMFEKLCFNNPVLLFQHCMFSTKL